MSHSAPSPIKLESIQTYEDAVRFLDGLDVSAMKLGLERIRAVLATLNNPQDALPMVHIAGTNGKGSVSAMLASILKAAGYTVGKFTSPHLVHVRERIAINGNPILPDDFQEEVVFLKNHLETLSTGKPEFSREHWPTYFEFLNIMAYHYFQRKNVEIAVFETGLGGRLDSTNVVRHPNLTVITGIDLEHTQHLGDTHAKIAAEKAGILKAGTPAILGAQMNDEARAAILEKAASLEVPVHFAQADPFTVAPSSAEEKKLILRHSQTGQTYALSLLAPYQKYNLAIVLEAVAQLRLQGFDISENAVQEGLAHTYWPVRFQYLERDRLLLDGSHNAQGFESLREGLQYYFADRPLYWLLSLRNNREDQALFHLLKAFPNTQGVVWTKAEPEPLYYAPEAMAEKTKRQWPKLDERIGFHADPAAALSQLNTWLSADPDALGVVTGSLYTAGAILAEMRKHT